jgi:hypothetical protein
MNAELASMDPGYVARHTRKLKKHQHGADIDIVTELIEHLTSRRENHKLTDTELIPKDGKVTRQQLLRVHATQHEQDLDTDYIVTQLRIFECSAS